MDPSPLLHPVGHLSARVYWVRRAVVAAVVLVVVVLLVRLLAGGGGGKAASPAAIGATPAATRTATPSSGPAAPAAPAPCADTALKVTAAVGATNYPLGSLPQLTVTVTNTGAAPCTRDLALTRRTLTVLSGTERIWSSADCSSATPAVQTLAPGKSVGLPVAWNRRRSLPSCPTPQPPLAGPGTYRLRGQLEGLPPVDGGSFTLS